MRDDLSVVLVSNRGPVSFAEEDGGFELRRGAGGLSGALDPVARRLGGRVVWIAATTSEEDRRAVAAGAADGLQDELGYPVYFLDFDPKSYAEYYDVVSNRMLWFAVHCLWDEMGVKEFGDREVAAWDDAYQPINERFARAVLEIADSDSLVLIQDYHLTTAPGFLRAARPNQTIFHFTHSSFCGPDGLERLPAPIPRRVIEGMLGADLLGFHVAAWVEGFLRCCERIGANVDWAGGIVEHLDRRTWVREYPIPIDPRALRDRSGGEEASAWARRFSELTDGSLIVRADRTEPSKNIVRGFEAFGRLLDRREDLRASSRFVACLYESRQSMPEYRRYIEDIKASVAAVNERHEDSIHLFLEDDYDRTLGALREYDVLLVNPIMDGMNLVSKEGPTINARDGVLVLSPQAGSFEELGGMSVAIRDALDVEAIADALEVAIGMPGRERERRATELRTLIEARTPKDWIESQIDDLTEVQEGREPKTPPCNWD